jgi:hypothetical protein
MFGLWVADREGCKNVWNSLRPSNLKGYIQTVLESHLKELERKGITLSLPKGKA